jgi:peptidoglycan/xylan/chitin deacetylase (PgdA/CDA1 family)
VILLYHSIVDDDAPPERWCIGQALPLGVLRRHLGWVAENFELVSLSAYLGGTERSRRRTMALTFDDGVGSTYRRVAPFLLESRIPATFFVSTGHLNGGPLLWFCYLNALCFEKTHDEVVVEGRRFPLRDLPERIEARRGLESLARKGTEPGDFTRELEHRYPISREILEEYGGMSHAEVRAAAESGSLEIGAHTVTHPFLTRLAPEEQFREIEMSRSELAAKTGRAIRHFAYPAGDYDAETLAAAKRAGFDAAFATTSRRLRGDGAFEIDRVGIYSPPLWKLKLKARGAATARRLGIQVG